MGDLSDHFSRREFACKDGCGRDTIDTETLDVLEEVRGHFGKPVLVHSGYRCMKHNKAVGGAVNSQHLYGRAADISIRGVPPTEIAAYLKAMYPSQYGVGLYKTFVHVDTRSGKPARW